MDGSSREKDTSRGLKLAKSSVGQILTVLQAMALQCIAKYNIHRLNKIVEVGIVHKKYTNKKSGDNNLHVNVHVHVQVDILIYIYLYFK